MKRTYDYSFIPNSPMDQALASTSSHSFSHATQAAHFTNIGLAQNYLPQHLMLSKSITTLPSTSRDRSSVLVQDPRSANVFRTPLTGLGITFADEYNKTLNTAPLSVSYSVPVSHRHHLGTYLSGSYSPFLYDDFNPTTYANGSILQRHENSDVSDTNILPMGFSGAYSTCPGNDYTACSPLDSRLEYPTESLASTPDLSIDQVMDDIISLSPLEDAPMLSPPSDSEDQTMIGLVADVNYRQQGWHQELPTTSVNPALLMGSEDDDPTDADIVEQGHQTIEQQLEYEDYRSSAPSPESTVSLDNAVTAIVSLFSASMAKEEPAEQTVTTVAVTVPNSTPTVQRQHVGNPCLTLPTFATRSTKSQGAAPNVPAPRARPPFRSPLINITNNTPATAPIKMGSPVLNAHLGIPVEELRRKAEDFRMNNPGCDIDKDWLQSFAGRLSDRGELLPDFRCYVMGCSQTNKRRDHILVHVGSHVEYRPFECETCGMRFLRRNECKRHATSHSGAKPFTCNMCPPERNRAFVRQDLLKRHLKVTHGIYSSTEHGNKRAKLMDHGGGFEGFVYAHA